MKKKLRGMTLAAALLLASPSAQADNTFVGDLTANEAYPSAISPIPNYAPVTVGDLQPAGFVGDCDSCDSGCDSGCDAGCDSGCDGGCDSMGSGPFAKKMAKALNMCETDGWIRAEGLIMFMQARTSPALVSSSAPGTFPALPPTSTGVVEFGGDDALDGGVSGGFRGDIGRYITDNLGIGGRFTWIGENSDSYSASGTGAVGERSIGRPYFFIPTVNPGLAQEDALIVNQANLFSGSVEADFATEIYGAEAYARFRWCKNKASRLEMLGGYSYLSLEDTVRIRSTTTDLGTGTATTFRSQFDTRNRFNGGQIGFDSLITRGCWSARTLAKVHLGNMRQQSNIYGATDEVTPPNPPVATTNSSLLVGAAQGEEIRDEFTFIPELNFTLGYRFRDHVSFTVGYNFMYFDNVALAGEQINRYIDTTNLGAQVTPVGYQIVDGSLWVQGISLGASVDY